MGGGPYDAHRAYSTRVETGAYTKSIGETFTQTVTHSQMSPHGITLRESHDLDGKASWAIVLGLDVTGSMGGTPHHLCQDGLPNIMGKIISNGEPHPQVLFLGIGDHECDSAPLQVGQFEADDQLLDGWLQKLWIEGRGGGNMGESYMLAWYFAAMHTETHCWQKRQRKGLCVTIGDEPCLPSIRGHNLMSIMGMGQQGDYRSSELLELARETYDVYHVHLLHDGMSLQDSGRRGVGQWREWLGDNLVVAQGVEQVPEVIAEIAASCRIGGSSSNVEQDEGYVDNASADGGFHDAAVL